MCRVCWLSFTQYLYPTLCHLHPCIPALSASLKMKYTSAQRRDAAELAQRKRDAEIEVEVVDGIRQPLTGFTWLAPIDYDAPEACVRANYQYVIAPSTPVRFADPLAGVNVVRMRRDEEAGVDIPCETPNSMPHDTPAATPASTMKQTKQERRAAVAGAMKQRQLQPRVALVGAAAAVEGTAQAAGHAPALGSNVAASASESVQGGGVHGMAPAAVATPGAKPLATEADAPVNVSTTTTTPKSLQETWLPGNVVLSPSNTKEETADDSFHCPLNANSGASGGDPFVGAEAAVLPKAYTEAETNSSFFKSWLDSRSNANSKGKVDTYVAL